MRIFSIPERLDLAHIADRAKALSGIILFASLCAYVIGFIVIGAYLWQYSIHDLDVLQPKYVGAGVSFLLWTAGLYWGLCFLLSFLVTKAFPNDRVQAYSYYGLCLIVITPMLVFYIGGAFFLFKRYQFELSNIVFPAIAVALVVALKPLSKYEIWKKQVENGRLTNILLALCTLSIGQIVGFSRVVFFLIFIGSLYWMFSGGEGTSNSQSYIRESFVGVLIGFSGILSSIVFFGTYDYKFVKAYLGGGQPRVVTIAVSMNSTSHLDSLLKIEGPLKELVIVHETQDAIYALSREDKRKAVMIPKAQILAIRFGRYFGGDTD
ncbi:hypothetical protein [Candidatus Methylomirabilis sp.]|uniref:hypothetical protein n=1 Tax=Candidatus Methylomirabilis sp. TaxID=2032687 RepID=UPI003C747AD7